MKYIFIFGGYALAEYADMHVAFLSSVSFVAHILAYAGQLCASGDATICVFRGGYLKNFD